MWMRSAGTSSTAMILALSSRSLAASIIWARQPRGCCTSTSGSSSANGSWPTSSRAHQIAWPRPSGDCWRVKLKVPGSGKSCDNSARSAFLPRSTRVSSSSNWRSKWSSITALLRPVTKMKCSMPAWRASSTTCWISGRSTTGQHFLRHGLGRRQEAGSQAGDREYGFADAGHAGFIMVAGALIRSGEQKAWRRARVQMGSEC